VRHHIDFFWMSGLTSNAMYQRVNAACAGGGYDAARGAYVSELANPKVGRGGVTHPAPSKHYDEIISLVFIRTKH
jgi:hypothetical protein